MSMSMTDVPQVQLGPLHVCDRLPKDCKTSVSRGPPVRSCVQASRLRHFQLQQALQSPQRRHHSFQPQRSQAAEAAIQTACQRTPRRSFHPLRLQFGWHHGSDVMSSVQRAPATINDAAQLAAEGTRLPSLHRLGDCTLLAHRPIYRAHGCD